MTTSRGEMKEVVNLRLTPGDHADPPLVYHPHRCTFPPTWQQRRAFVQASRYGLSVTDLGGGSFLAALAYRLAGHVDQALLDRAVQAVVARHAALRTTFDLTGDEPVAVTHDELTVPVQVIDIADEQELTAHIRSAVADEPFHLDAGPLLRVRLLSVAPDEAVLVIVMHHIISDGWSFGIFLRELSEHYNAYGSGNAPSRADLPVQYGDYALWQGERSTEHQLAHWQARLRDLSPLGLPTDRPRAAVADRRAARVHLELSGPLVRSLRALGQTHRATLHMVLTSGLIVFLAGLCGSRDVVVGTPVANRHPHETEQLIGLFTNTLILRADLSDAECFRDVLGAVRSTAIEAYRHPDVPPESLVDSSEAPVRVTFVLQSFPIAPPDLDGISAREFPLPRDITTYDLTFSVTERHGGLDGYLQYRAALFDAATARRFADAWRDLLAEAAHDPSRPIVDLLRHGAGARPGSTR